MRLIDADKIPYVEAVKDTLEPSGKFYARREDICAMPTIKPQLRWIPCSERMPKAREWVLCQCRAGIMDVLRLTENGDWNKNYPHAEYMSGFVIAWMPLPEPYEEGE